MADRSSARAWGAVFTALAAMKSGGAVDIDQIAAQLWTAKEEQGADFSDDQMGADEDLATLGLVRIGWDTRWDEWCNVYGDEQEGYTHLQPWREGFDYDADSPGGT